MVRYWPSQSKILMCCSLNYSYQALLHCQTVSDENCFYLSADEKMGVDVPSQSQTRRIRVPTDTAAWHIYTDHEDHVVWASSKDSPVPSYRMEKNPTFAILSGVAWVGLPGEPLGRATAAAAGAGQGLSTVQPAIIGHLISISSSYVVAKGCLVVLVSYGDVFNFFS